ncbi:hypothetical protein C0995_005427 [Termitomyces sp. Mi166|nr:hypothetical protein C0995_005427 [Termitomyces sp. Mi166\
MTSNSADVSDFGPVASKTNIEVVARQEQNKVESTSAEIELALDRHFNDLKLEGSVTAEQFSRLDSTVTNILACPALVLFAAAAQDQPRLLEPEQTITNPEHPNTEIDVHPATQLVHVQESYESDASLVSRIPEDLPLLVATYADATNLAKQYPELAKEILTHPLPKLCQVSSSNMDRPLSPSLHHPDRPHWAAAPLETANTQPISGTSSNDGPAASMKSSKARRRGTRNKDGGVNNSSRGARRDSLSFLDSREKRHKPPPQHKGNRKYNRPTSEIPVIERLSKAWTNDIGSENDDTGTSTSHFQDWDGRPLAADNTDTSSNISSFSRSDTSAHHEISHDWGSTGAKPWNDIPNATNVPSDDTYQQAPFKSGSDRRERNDISTIEPMPDQDTTFRRVHKQQVSDLNTATLRHLGKGSTTSDQENQGTLSGSNWGVETSENPDSIQDKRFQRLSCSVPHDSIQSQRDLEKSAEEALTPKLRSDAYPFRDVQIQTINSSQIAAATPYCYSYDSKPDLSLVPQSQEHHTLNNPLYGSASDWTPVQHTAEDWLPPTASQNLGRTRVSHFVNTPDTYIPSKPATDGNRHHVTRNVSPSYPFGRKPHPNHSTSANWFGEAPAQDLSLANGPRPESTLLEYTPRSRQSLPAQTEAFAQYLTETYHSAKNNGRGRRWRADGRGGRGSSMSRAQPRRNLYGPGNSDDYPESEKIV